MNRKYILYNPEAGNGTCKENAEMLEVVYDDPAFVDMSQIESYEAFFRELDPSDEVIICGGDGTLNRFANNTENLTIFNPIYYFAVGNSNDFLRDLDLPENADPDFRINDYLRCLPRVSVHGQKYLFLNNVGFGIDGYCCEEGDRLRKKYKRKGQKKDVNYTMMAITGLLFRFKPRNAVITVDGVSHEFKKVWLAPTMQGRYYGGGMMVAPNQDRLSTDKTLSVIAVHSAGRLNALRIFLSFFRGKHIRCKKQVTVLTGHNITVEFDQPTPLQIDGEVFHDVRAYQAKSSMRTLAAKTAANGSSHE